MLINIPSNTKHFLLPLNKYHSILSKTRFLLITIVVIFKMTAKHIITNKNRNIKLCRYDVYFKHCFLLCTLFFTNQYFATACWTIGRPATTDIR